MYQITDGQFKMKQDNAEQNFQYTSSHLLTSTLVQVCVSVCVVYIPERSTTAEMDTNTRSAFTSDQFCLS